MSLIFQRTLYKYKKQSKASKNAILTKIDVLQIASIIEKYIR